MEASVAEVERILCYRFKNRKLLQEALTHSSFIKGVSYECLEFIGDPIISLAINNYLFLVYPNLDSGRLSILCATNISTEKLARVVVRYGLYVFVRHHAQPLMDQVERFVEAVALENPSVVSHSVGCRDGKDTSVVARFRGFSGWCDSGFSVCRLCKGATFHGCARLMTEVRRPWSLDENEGSDALAKRLAVEVQRRFGIVLWKMGVGLMRRCDDKVVAGGAAVVDSALGFGLGIRVSYCWRRC